MQVQTMRKRRREGNEWAARVERRYTIQRTIRWLKNRCQVGPQFSSSAPPRSPAPPFDHFPFGPGLRHIVVPSRPCAPLHSISPSCHAYTNVLNDLTAIFRPIEKTAEHAKGCGFTRAIGTEQAEDFSSADFEADVIDRREVAKAPHQIANLNDGFIILPLWRPFERHGSRELPLRSCSLQQDHESVFESRFYCIDGGTIECIYGCSSLTIGIDSSYEPHAATFRQRVQHARLVHQSWLQAAGLLPCGWRGDIRPSLGQSAYLCG